MDNRVAMIASVMDDRVGLWWRIEPFILPVILFCVVLFVLYLIVMAAAKAADDS